jgi:hypothetical protein
MVLNNTQLSLLSCMPPLMISTVRVHPRPSFPPSPQGVVCCFQWSSQILDKITEILTSLSSNAYLCVCICVCTHVCVCVRPRLSFTIASRHCMLFRLGHWKPYFFSRSEWRHSIYLSPFSCLLVCVCVCVRVRSLTPFLTTIA